MPGPGAYGNKKQRKRAIMGSIRVLYGRRKAGTGLRPPRAHKKLKWKG